MNILYTTTGSISTCYYTNVNVNVAVNENIKLVKEVDQLKNKFIEYLEQINSMKVDIELLKKKVLNDN